MTPLRAVPDRPRRALGYIRVSMAREEMVSPELQLAAIEAHCQRTNRVLVDVIEDLDATGRNFVRAGVQEAIDRIERGEADDIVVWKVSRFGRNARDWHINADRVEVVGGNLESATEGFDPRTSTGRLTRGLLVELAEWESNVKSEQWKEAHEHRYRAGLTHNGGARFGYVFDKAKNIHVVDKVTGPLLAECYRRYIAGETPGQICGWLNSVGARTTVGGEWTPNTLRHTLAKGFGAGLIYRKTQKNLIPGAHQPVIDEATWKAYLRRKSRSATEPARAREGVHPLTGLVRCTCGKTMNVWAGTVDGKKYHAYRCYRGCRRCYAPQPALHAAVKEWLAAEVAADLDARTETKAQQMAKRTLAKSERAEIEKSIRALEKSIARLTDAFARGITPESAYTTTVAALTAEREGLESRLVEVHDDIDASRRSVRALARSIVADYDQLVELDPAGMKEVLRQLIAEIRVRPGKELEGKYAIVPRWA